jgi:signal transduction histidine kinase
MRRIVSQLLIGVLLVLIAVTVGGTLAARRLAERSAVNDAANTAGLLAEAVVTPALTDELLTGDPKAVQEFDDLVREGIITPDSGVKRVKLWRKDGTILYSDQRELIGDKFPLGEEELEVLAHPRTVAEISDLSRPENKIDRKLGNKLVEVYRPVWTPSGKEALFEIYTPYTAVSQRTSQLWRGFAGVTLTSLLLFVLLLAPLLWHLLRRVRRAQRQRELLLERAVDASATERRRIAATLHDGPVQDLAATSFVIAGATAQARATGQSAVVEELGSVSASVRTSIRALRSLLVDIYPASLAQAGLGAALTDLATSVRAQGLDVRVDSDDDLGLSLDQERLVYRVAQETLRNAAKHAAPCTVTITLYRVQEADDMVVLDVVDDGNGFDVAERVARPEPGHFGLQLLADLAQNGGALLQVASAPGRGTHWRLQVHRGGEDAR